MNSSNAKQGALFAVTAYGFWGLIPIFFKTVAAASPGEILAQRVLWSAILLLVLLKVLGKTGDLLAVFRDGRRLKPLVFSALLISTNWLVFIWAVNDERVLETSLGYYITPLISVFLATVVLKERLNTLQLVAIGLAAVGVINQLFSFGKLPWVALTLAVSFAGYGLIRKKISIDPFVGLTVETCLLLPISIGYLVYLQYQGELAFLHQGASLDVLLIMSGFVTAFPLLMFAAAANRLTLTSLGIFQYIGPSVSFLLAVSLYGEPFSTAELVTFLFIWLALAVFCIDSLKSYKKIRG